MGIGKKVAATFGIVLVAAIAFVWMAGAGADNRAAEMTDRAAAGEEAVVEPSEPATVLEAAILDAFDGKKDRTPEETEKWHNAVDFVRTAINSEGFLCAVPYEMQKASDQMYGIGCITNRDKTGKANYLVDTATGKVTEL